MIIKGVLTFTSDINIAQFASRDPNARVLYLSDTEGIDIKSLGFLSASALVPDYNILSDIINGNIPAFTQKYTEYLNMPVQSNYIAAILTALVRGINIVLYYPKDVEELYYPKFLQELFSVNFGISPSTRTSNFMYYGDSYDDNILNFIYHEGAIPCNEFLLLCTNADQDNILKLIHDYQLCSPEKGPTKDISYYISILREKKDIMKKAGRPLVSMFSMEV